MSNQSRFVRVCADRGTEAHAYSSLTARGEGILGSLRWMLFERSISVVFFSVLSASGPFPGRFGQTE
eukprot:1921675-Pyramimonas_sp.AAC.1